MKNQIQNGATLPSSVLFGVAWGAYPTTDDMGRLGKCIGWYSTKQSARLQAKGKGWYGGDGSVVKAYTITAEGKTYRLETKTPIKVDDSDEVNVAIRERVLSKLTPAEREALGYPPNDSNPSTP
jgi:hypothetical protein